jgi:hypothetical protein
LLLLKKSNNKITKIRLVLSASANLWPALKHESKNRFPPQLNHWNEGEWCTFVRAFSHIFFVILRIIIVSNSHVQFLQTQITMRTVPFSPRFSFERELLTDTYREVHTTKVINCNMKIAQISIRAVLFLEIQHLAAALFVEGGCRHRGWNPGRVGAPMHFCHGATCLSELC